MKSVIVGYSDRDSVRPGDSIAFKVSCENAPGYRADIVRLHCPDTSSEGPGYRETEVPSVVNGTYPARVQSMNIGSYIRIGDAEIITTLSSFTVVLAVWPTAPGKASQALVGNWDPRQGCGWGLSLDADGAPAFQGASRSNQVNCSTGVPLSPRSWHLLAASFDAKAKAVTLHQMPLSDARVTFDEPVVITCEADIDHAAGRPEITVAAWLDGDVAHNHFDGKIDRPRLFSRAMTAGEIAASLLDQFPRRIEESLVAAWNFSVGIETDAIVDEGPNRLDGLAINLPARGQTGFNWSGKEYCWKNAPDEYGAIHFHSDDLYDAGWPTDFTLAVGTDMKSGIYAARLRSTDHEFYIPFYVRPPRGRRTADAVFLIPTATYLAYANNRGRILSPATDYLIGKLTVVDATDLLIVERPEYGLSTYDAHRDGSSVNYSSRLRPVSNHRPKDSDMGMAYNNFAPDMLVVDWLEHTGVPFDVLTDEDLHHEGAKALEGYRVVITGTHPEYASLCMLNALTHFTRNGGRLMYLGGNGFYWRVAFRDDKPGCIELRRAQVNSPRWNPGLGQYFHSFSGEHGGLWRDLGRAPQMLCGVGFVAQGFDCSSYYLRTNDSRNPRVGFMFDGIEDEVLGDFGLLRGGAAGIEIDRTDDRYGTPSHALVVAHSESHTNIYEPFEDVVAMGQPLPGDRPPIRADMVFFECPGGGAVFSVGSIAYAGSLSHNGYSNNINRLTTNVLRRFLSSSPFPMPSLVSDK